MVFENRISTYPNRYLMTDENGNKSHITLERADEPLATGTPLSAETFNAMQEEIQIEDENHPGCFYRLENDVKLWVNPPMELNTWYNTVERFKGRSVKVLAIEVSLTDSTEDSFTIPLGEFSGGTIINITGTVGSEEVDYYEPVPFYLAENLYCHVLFQQRKLYVSHPASYENLTLRLVIKYI